MTTNERLNQMRYTHMQKAPEPAADCAESPGQCKGGKCQGKKKEPEIVSPFQ